MLKLQICAHDEERVIKKKLESDIIFWEFAYPVSTSVIDQLPFDENIHVP